MDKQSAMAAFGAMAGRKQLARMCGHTHHQGKERVKGFGQDRM